MEEDRLIELARQLGFEHLGKLNVCALEFLPEVRDMCADDRCHKYKKSWSCPPACGSLADIAAKAGCYTGGVLVQTTAVMEDAFDLEAITRAQKLHKERFAVLCRRAKLLFPQVLPMAAGACTLCRRCTYPDRPCRYPAKVFPSMEAYGLLVGEVCKKSGLLYYYGEKTITYTACILCDKKSLAETSEKPDLL